MDNYLERVLRADLSRDRYDEILRSRNRIRYLENLVENLRGAIRQSQAKYEALVQSLRHSPEDIKIQRTENGAQIVTFTI